MELDSIPVELLDGTETTFGDLAQGRVVLLVNVASRCGLSPQYEKLEELQRKYGDRGFTVVGVPSNQFLQEPGSAESIAEYCSTTWGTTFPMLSKARVNGKNAHPLYKQVTEAKDASGKAGRVKWNFEKFLISSDGEVRRFRPTTVPDAPEIIEQIESWLP